MIRRNSFQIIRDGLLGIHETGVKTSGFMYIGNMSNDQTQEYFNLCLKRSLLEKDGKKYRVTDKGWKFIQAVETNEKLLGVEKQEAESEGEL